MKCVCQKGHATKTLNHPHNMAKNETAATVTYEYTINNQYYFEILSKTIIKQLCITLNILTDKKWLIGVLARRMLYN